MAEQNGGILGRSGVSGRQCRLWLARVLGWVLVLQFLLTPTSAQALNWRLPGRGTPAPPRSPAGQAPQRLQEVAPPDWVQKAQAALEERDPKVEILAPADGTLLPNGPWTLRLRVSDWPLVDAGPLGLGPHLVVQLDGQPPLPVVDSLVEMPPLSPGSHLLSVYAAKPWGEAHKSPAALQQIRLHRLAPNPATLPAPGTPQLLPVSPTGPLGDPPLLLDWLLIDAPLQGLRTDTLGWRLRVTLNGESVLVDRQVPLWLKGWRSGSNALLLELLDGRGEPLNAPFNSLLREVILSSSAGPSGSQAHALTSLEMAVLVGDQPPSVLAPAPPPPSDEQTTGETPSSPAPKPSPSPNGSAQIDPAQTEVVSGGDVEVPPEKEPPQPAPTQPEPPQPALTQPELPQPVPTQQEPAQPAEPPSLSQQPAERTDGAASALDGAEPASAPQLAPAADPTPGLASRQSPAPDQRPLPAREEVNADGTLKRPERPSPIERLRQRLQR